MSVGLIASSVFDMRLSSSNRFWFRGFLALVVLMGYKKTGLGGSMICSMFTFLPLLHAPGVGNIERNQDGTVIIFIYFVDFGEGISDLIKFLMFRVN